MKRNLFTRISIVGYCFSIACLLIVVQLVRVQNNVSAKALRDEATDIYEYNEEIVYPERGYIYDRWGHLLASNKEVYEIGINLVDVENPETIARDLDDVLGLDYYEVLNNIKTATEKSPQGYMIVANFVDSEMILELERRQQDYDEAPIVKSLYKSGKISSLDGLEWNPHLQRVYPENDLASNVLGFYSFLDQNQGRPYFGIEENYNDVLEGNPIKVSIPVDPNKIQEIPTIPPGSSLILTIDREIQIAMEKVIDNAVKSNKAVSGTLMVMDPENGEILAMATSPRLNPNKYWEFEEMFAENTPYNKAVSETFEPGSIFKVLTMAAALDNGSVKPETTFLDTGIIHIGGVDIYNWDREAWGPQTMLGCMQHSLNVCLSWVATQLGPSAFYDYMHAFGIGHRTSIDLAGEAVWPLSVPGDETWSEANLATNSFGQGVAITPVQMITAVGAIANEGKMMAPHVLSAIIEDGHQYNTNPQVIGNPISAETASTLTNMLATSLEVEASDALVEGYKVAGKTGTAEIPGPYGYVIGLTNASFIGWGPVDDPKFVVYVWLEKPQTSIWGSIVAAPVFSEAVSELVVLMNLPPDDIRQKLTFQ